MNSKKKPIPLIIGATIDPHERLRALDQRLGKDVGAKKERKRLNEMIKNIKQ